MTDYINIVVVDSNKFAAEIIRNGFANYGITAHLFESFESAKVSNWIPSSLAVLVDEKLFNSAQVNDKQVNSAYFHNSALFFCMKTSVPVGKTDLQEYYGISYLDVSRMPVLTVIKEIRNNTGIEIPEFRRVGR